MLEGPRSRLSRMHFIWTGNQQGRLRCADRAAGLLGSSASTGADSETGTSQARPIREMGVW